MSGYQTIELKLGDIPGRTGVEVHILLDPRTGVQSRVLHYRCLDCKFRTNLVEEAFEHHKDAPIWHKVKGAIKGSFWTLPALNAISSAMAVFLIVEPIVFNLPVYEAALLGAWGGALLAYNFWILMKRRDLNAKTKANQIAASGLTQ